MRRVIIPALAFVFLVMVFFLFHSKASAQNANQKAGSGYVGDVSICQTCHQKQYDQLSKTPMGVLLLKHPRNGVEKLGCEACHGPAAAHVASGGTKLTGLIRFTKGSSTPVSVRNAVCLKCHQKGERFFWSGSVHQSHGLACTTCHTVHGPGATTRYQLARFTVSNTCATCHKTQVRSEHMFSHHPLAEGKMTCASCHNPHGTVTPHLIRGLSVKELCFKCHAQYRGPFIFEHPPVMENCFICHQPHGSPYPNLLKAPPVRLCRECHIAFHNLAINGNGVTIRLNQALGAGACLNCHRMIHGSNSMTSHGRIFFR